MEVEGTVVSCALAEGGIHELGIKLEREVDPGLFCQAAVHHRVLLAEDTPPLARLAEVHLKKLNAKVDCVPDGKQAVELALKNTYDLILMDLDMPVLDGFEATKQLRAAGFSGLIVAFSALTDSTDQERALEAGCNKFLGKPYTRDDLAELLKFLALEPIYSTMQGDPALEEIIKDFVNEFPSRVRALEAAIIKQDLDGLFALLRSLKGAAGSYGFDIISEAAIKLEAAMSQNLPWDELKHDLASLVKLCGQVRA